MSDLIRFECPQCHKSLAVKPQHAGKSTKCPGCQCLLKVPSPVANEQDFFRFLEDAEPATSPQKLNPRDDLYQQLSQAADSGANDQALAIIAQLKEGAASDEFNDLWALEREIKRRTPVSPPAISTNNERPTVSRDPIGEVPSSTPDTPTATTPNNSLANSVPDTQPTSGPTPDLTGTKSCPFCAETVLAAAKKCKHCGEFLDPVLIRSQSQGAVSATTPAQPDEAIIRRIHDWEHLSSILWIVLGAIQIVAGFALAGVPTLVGIANVVGGIQSRKLLRRILNRDTTIPGEYQPVVWMVIVGIFNFVLGGVIGIGLTIFDFVIRDKVLSNRQLFNVTVATAS